MIKRLTILLMLLSCTIGIQAQTSKVNVTFDGWSGDAKAIVNIIMMK